MICKLLIASIYHKCQCSKSLMSSEKNRFCKLLNCSIMYYSVNKVDGMRFQSTSMSYHVKYLGSFIRQGNVITMFVCPYIVHTFSIVCSSYTFRSFCFMLHGDSFQYNKIYDLGVEDGWHPNHKKKYILLNFVKSVP